MALQAGQKRVNRAVHYHHSDGRIRVAIITALQSGDNVDLRVGRHGETYTNIPNKTTFAGTNTWYAGSRRQYA